MSDDEIVQTMRRALRTLYPLPDRADLDISAAVDLGRRRRRSASAVMIAACVLAVVALAIVATRIGPSRAPAASTGGTSSLVGGSSGPVYATFDFTDSQGNTFTEVFNSLPVMIGKVLPADPQAGDADVSVSLNSTGSTGSITNTTGREVPSPDPVELDGYWPSASAVCSVVNAWEDGGNEVTFKVPAGSYCRLRLTWSQYNGVSYNADELPPGTTLPAGATAEFSCACAHEGLGYSGLSESIERTAVTEYQSGPSFILAGPVPLIYSPVLPGHQAKIGACAGDPGYVGGYVWESTPIVC
jgi:hypothetical protein